MNQTTEDSRQFGEVVGGDTITTENGVIEMPPEEAKSFDPVLEGILREESIEIPTENAKAEDVLNKEQIEELKENIRKRPNNIEKDREAR